MNCEVLNNREWALVSWISVTLILFAFNKAFQTFLKDIVEILFSNSLGLVLIGMLAYITLLVGGLYKVGFWDLSMLKDTIVWTITVGFVMLGNSITKASKEDRYFRDVVIENLRLTVYVEFIVNLYVFDFWIELLLVPVTVLLGGMMAVAGSKPEYSQVTKFLNILVALFGFICIIYAIYHIIAGFTDFATLQNLDGFLLPILLTFGFLPYAYFLALYSAYQLFLLNIENAYRHKPLMKKYTKWQVCKLAYFNLSMVRMLAKNLHVHLLDTKKQLKESLKEITSRNNNHP